MYIYVHLYTYIRIYYIMKVVMVVDQRRISAEDAPGTAAHVLTIETVEDMARCIAEGLHILEHVLYIWKH